MRIPTIIATTTAKGTIGKPDGEDFVSAVGDGVGVATAVDFGC